jgi:hypothetical protein
LHGFGKTGATPGGHVSSLPSAPIAALPGRFVPRLG